MTITAAGQAWLDRCVATALSAEDVEYLKKAGLDERRIAAVRSIRRLEDLPTELRSWGKKAIPALLFTWTTVSGERIPQLRLRKQFIDGKGKDVRYLLPSGCGGMVGIDNLFRDHYDDKRTPVLFVEGTKQFLSACSTIDPADPIAAPFGIVGCYGWSTDGQPSSDVRSINLDDREVLVCFDADVETNYNVYTAAAKFQDHLIHGLGARSVKFIRIPGGGKTGLDDVLGGHPAGERRARVLRRLIDHAAPLPKRGPRKPARDSAFYDSNGLRPIRAWQYLEANHHLALCEDHTIAVYENGVYRGGSDLPLRKILLSILDNHYRHEQEKTIVAVVQARLHEAGRTVKLQQERPILNFRNGLLDLSTLELRPHTPDHLSLVQIPCDWSPGAVSPTFDRWIEEVLPGQRDALLSVCSQMLDQTRPPTQIVFLWGPSRSGKSTFLRILRRIAGEDLTASVSLQALAADKFASSQLFGKILNVYADLSAEELKDLSTIKCLTGGDPITAQRKFGQLFTLDNMAMLVFSANTVPAVSEASRAYFARTSAFHFARSFEGRIDPLIETAMVGEIDGITRLLVLALRERQQTGRFIPPDPHTQRVFAEHSDRVRRFLAERTVSGDRSSRCIARSALFDLWKDWLADDGGSPMGRNTFFERVRAAGVEEVKLEGGHRVWNLILRGPGTAEDDPKTAEISPRSAEDRVGGFGEGQKSAEDGLSATKSAEGSDPSGGTGSGELTGSSSAVSAVSALSPLNSLHPSEKNKSVCNRPEVPKLPKSAEDLTPGTAVDLRIGGCWVRRWRLVEGPDFNGLYLIEKADDPKRRQHVRAGAIRPSPPTEDT